MILNRCSFFVQRRYLLVTIIIHHIVKDHYQQETKSTSNWSLMTITKASRLPKLIIRILCRPRNVKAIFRCLIQKHVLRVAFETNEIFIYTKSWRRKFDSKIFWPQHRNSPLFLLNANSFILYFRWRNRQVVSPV